MTKVQYRTKKITVMVSLIIILSIIVLLSNGCTKSETGKLTIGLMSDIGAVPFLIAKENGYFEDLGLDVELQVFKSALDRDAGLQTGNLQGAMADMLTVFFFNEADVGMGMTSATYGNYIMVTSPEFTADEFMLETEKSIGMSSNTVIDFATQLIAKDKGFGDQLQSTAIPQMPVRLEMLKNSELAGATLPDPLASVALLEGGEVVGDTKELGLYPGIFIFSDETIKNNPEAIEQFYVAYNQAVDYLNQTDSSEYFQLLVDNLSFPGILTDNFSMPTFSKATAADEHTFDVTLEWMKGQGLIENTYDYSDLSDASMLEK
ncbi:MAG: ABC transporter substrate-binding protein [Vallitaleaceae bacterium]|jgi:NitT/TauT family transport system substrate-binding protein|nr:ABC transporter substrate-binding protein [Vallitaleaceae bacterium]